MQNQSSHQDISQADLERLKKPEIVELFMQLQAYTKKIESLTNQENVVVRLDERVFHDNDFWAEFMAFVASISESDSLAEGERGHMSNWIKIDGRLRPNYGHLNISNEIDGDWVLRNISAAYLVPKPIAEALKPFAHALRNRQIQLRNEYEKNGKNFLVQMVKKDLLGEATK